jgi:hypothetical protein
MPAIANGVSSLVTIGKQTAEGTKLAAASAAALRMRRVTAEFNTEADKYSSNEIKASQQQNDTRLGNFHTVGNLKGELSSGTYANLLASACRKDFSTPATESATSATASTLVGTNFLTNDKVNVGQVIYCTGFVTNTANNNRNLLVTNVTATIITFIPLDGTPLVAETASITITMRGKYTYCPATGHTKDFFTVEVLDVAGATTICRTFVDQLIDKVDISFQANGMVTSDFSFMGKTEDPVLSAAYFSAPTAATASGNFAGATGILVVGGTANVICTGMSLSINEGVKIDSVIGSKYATAASRGKITVSGQFSVFFSDSTYLEYFRNETEQNIIFVATSVDGNFISIHCPRIKITSASTNDGEINKVVTCNFDALEYSLDAAYTNTTLQIQDSAA